MLRDIRKEGNVEAEDVAAIRHPLNTHTLLLNLLYLMVTVEIGGSVPTTEFR